MLEIRVHGRGAQGAVTTGQIIAVAAFKDGKYSQTFPVFGVERCGAPVRSFCRIDSRPINIRSEVYSPDISLVFEPSLIKDDNVTEGLKAGGTIIVNSNLNAKQLGINGSYKVYTIDATSVALKIFKRPIGVNTAILGGFAAITKIITIDSLNKAIDEIFIERKGEKIANLNKEAVKEVYERYVVGSGQVGGDSKAAGRKAGGEKNG